MAENIPKHEPESFIAGDTVKWTRSVTVHGEARLPADSWVLTYYFTSAAKKESVVATDNGDGAFLATIAAATSADWTAGVYSWIAVVSKAAERFTVASGTTCVEPDFATIGAKDTRSWASRVLEAIEAVMADKASDDQLSMSVGGTSISRMSWAELMQARDRLRAEVARDNRAERIAQGLGHSGKILVRL